MWEGRAMTGSHLSVGVMWGRWGRHYRCACTRQAPKGQMDKDECKGERYLVYARCHTNILCSVDTKALIKGTKKELTTPRQIRKH